MQEYPKIVKELVQSGEQKRLYFLKLAKAKQQNLNNETLPSKKSSRGQKMKKVKRILNFVREKKTLGKYLN